MKLSDVTGIKSLISGLPVSVLHWLATILLISTITLGYFGGRHWFNNYLEKQEQARQRDAILLEGQAAIILKLNRVDDKIDSLGKNLILVNEKVNTAGLHIQKIERGNSSILYEFRKLDDLYQLFGMRRATNNEKKVDTTRLHIVGKRIKRMKP